MKAEFFQPPIDNLKLGILWDYLRGKFNIIDIEEKHFQGDIVGSEFLTYDIKKLYIPLRLSILDTGSPVPNALVSYMQLYDENNSIFTNIASLTPVWDTTAAALKYGHSNLNDFNTIYFSRLLQVGLNGLVFTGYKLTLL